MAPASQTYTPTIQGPDPQDIYFNVIDERWVSTTVPTGTATSGKRPRPAMQANHWARTLLYGLSHDVVDLFQHDCCTRQWGEGS